MMGALASGLKLRSWGTSAAALIGLSLGVAAATGPAVADKVGVAAAVNPDAFSSLAGSPQSQLNIGKSIFYNERINTTGSGLVQVLLVDGSTFTVGPGSDLVIDRFVYDPKKGAGQISASFSKGVMRFVGGKISKNEGGVAVNTPAGVLAIRGAIALGQISSPKNFAFMLVFGDYLKLRGDTVFQPGYGFFSNNGVLEKRPFSPDDLKFILSSLTNGNSAGGGGQTNGKPNNFQLATTESMSEIISDANTSQIQGQTQDAQNDQTNDSTAPTCEETGTCEPPPTCEETGTCEPPPTCEQTGTCEPPPPPPSAEKGAPGGYAAGVYDRQGGEQETGLLQDVLFNPQSNSVSFGISGGETVLLQFDDEGDPISASATRNGEPLDIIQFKSQTQLTQRTDLICSGCDFLRWGNLAAHLNYRDTSNLFASGWWVEGERTTVGDIDKLAALGAGATYQGSVWGTVINAGERYDSSGALTMNWSFRDRNGDLTISDFDDRSYSTGAHGLTQPSLDVNQFSGSLKQTGGPDIGLTSGSATGSFVNNGSVAAGGVMGKWGVEGDRYQATGVFGGAGTPR